MQDMIDKIRDKIKVLTANGTPQDRYTNGVLDGLRIALEIMEAKNDR